MLLGNIKVLKNQDFAEDVNLMGYKRDDVDASFGGGSFISLYNTNPIALDDLTVISGYGTQCGFKKMFDNSLMELVIE